MSKCLFAQNQVEYLGHVVSSRGVEPIGSKIQAIQQWPIPQSTRALHSFLGLAGFYQCFIHGYASIAAPLNHLMTKDSFVWSLTAQQAFDMLKEALTTAPVLLELCAITTAVKKWHQYLLGHPFVILTDHHSLKELMTQVVETPKQQTYLAILLGYDYHI
ncbi:uncharacterized protein LOC114383841 [Glycine soja]|uniref:uncharacterized protein LOC114383841 n=1 Tax=Glycine soja TaxID=3848 RepID=UPI00103E151B|nr:uncharacterized protein LOC114383841 [Glycine soja]